MTALSIQSGPARNGMSFFPSAPIIATIGEDHAIVIQDWHTGDQSDRFAAVAFGHLDKAEFAAAVKTQVPDWFTEVYKDFPDLDTHPWGIVEHRYVLPTGEQGDAGPLYDWCAANVPGAVAVTCIPAPDQR